MMKNSAGKGRKELHEAELLHSKTYKGVAEKVALITYLSEQVKYLNSYETSIRIEFYKLIDEIPSLVRGIIGDIEDNYKEGYSQLIDVNLGLKRAMETIKNTIE